MTTTKNSCKKYIFILIVAVIAISLFFIAYYGIGTNRASKILSLDEAQVLVDDTIDNIPRASADGSKYIFDNVGITVKDVERGEGKSLIFKCDYSAYDVKSILEPNIDDIFNSVYKFYYDNKNNGIMTNATKVNIETKETIINLLSGSDLKVSGEIDITVYEINKGDFKLHLDRNIVNAVTGGMQDIVDAVNACTTVNYNGNTVDITPLTTLRSGIVSSFEINDYYSIAPYTGTALKKAVDSFKDDFHKNFIEDNRWKYLARGLGTTLGLTGLSALLGVFLGFIVAIVRCTNQTTGKFKAVDAVCRLYLTVFRGTPLMVQLLIIYFIVLLPVGIPKFFAAIICFGLNSGAYVAEIIRGGIMSVDNGQMEAGRSLGFNYAQTMVNFIAPQAFKAVLPSLVNEFITLLKESSVAFYLGVADLTQGGLVIRSRTFSNFMPLIAVALIYLILVIILTLIVGKLERRLHKDERHRDRSH